MAANNKNLLHPMMSSHLKSGFVPPKKELCIYISELVTHKNFPRGLPFECSGCRTADEQHLCRTSFTGKGVMYCLDCVYKRIYQERRERAPGPTDSKIAVIPTPTRVKSEPVASHLGDFSSNDKPSIEMSRNTRKRARDDDADVEIISLTKRSKVDQDLAQELIQLREVRKELEEQQQEEASINYTWAKDLDTTMPLDQQFEVPVMSLQDVLLEPLDLGYIQNVLYGDDVVRF